MSLLIHFADDGALEPEVVGFKFAALARASRAGFAVPPAVAVATAADRAFRRDGSPPDGLRDELRRAAAELDLARGVSVRSSATREDLADKSFAGLYETFLGVTSEGELIDRIERCWRSADSERVRAYLRAGGVEGEPPLMAVIVQRMVHAAAAGVAFSRDPLGRRTSAAGDEVVVEAVSGLADELVAGHVSPHRIYVPRGGEPRVESPPGGADRAPGGPELWWRVAELARAVEERLGEGRPQDVEWAADEDGEVWLLQARPITALAEEGAAVPAGTWTRGIAVDLWADRLSPFLGDHMVRQAHRFDFSRTSRFVGIPVVQPALAVIDGFLYVNCASLEKVLTVLPRRLRLDDLRAYFPPGHEIDAVPPPGLGKLLSFGLRSALLGLVAPQGNPLLCEALSRRGLARLGRELAAIDAIVPGSPAEALAKVGRATETLARLQVHNQWPYFYATLFTVGLRWLVVDRAGLAHADFLRLIGGGTKNVTSAIEGEFRDLASLIARDPELRRRFLAEPAESLVGTLPAEVQAPFDAFLERYGCRARHRALYWKRWIEAPEEVLGMLKPLLRELEACRERESPDPPEPDSPPAAADAGGAEADPGRELPLAWRPLLWPVHRFARRFLDLREDLRFFLDRVLLTLRRSLLELGGLSGLGEETFSLTADELRQSVAGRFPLDRALDLAAGRRRRLTAAADAHAFYVDGRPVAAAAAGDLLRGLGTSRGRVRGRARIVDDPTRSEIRPGDILVARNTDPGWTPVLSAVAGLVVEEGGLLNHCSIVARELGVPAVVGVYQATRRIPEGALVVVDGDLGRVELAAETTGGGPGEG